MGEVREIAEVVLYLESAAFVTGETLHVDGGAHTGHWYGHHAMFLDRFNRPHKVTEGEPIRAALGLGPAAAYRASG